MASGPGPHGIVTTDRVRPASPLIRIPADQRVLDELPFDAVGRKYVGAVTNAARAQTGGQALRAGA